MYTVVFIASIILALIFACKLSNAFSGNYPKFKKGLLVLAKIKKITLIKMDQNGTLRDAYEVNCQFEYNGLREADIYLSKEAGTSLKIGDTIECIYDSKADILITKKEDNFMKELNSSVLKMVLITFALFIIFAFKFFN